MSKSIGKFFSKNNIIDFQDIICIDKAIIVTLKTTEFLYSLDNIRYFKTKVVIENGYILFNNLVCRYLKLPYDFEIEVFQGSGYIGEANKDWTDLFATNNYWVGGDGLYSFNLNGHDNYNSEEYIKTLCVFGDTFFCTLGHNQSRLSPLAMPNNSYCIINHKNPKKAKVDFYINEDEYGHCKAYLEPNNDLCFSGTMASNLVNQNLGDNDLNYLSGYAPKNKIEIEFDLNGEYLIDYIDVYNYFVDSDIDLNYQNRGIKNVDIYLDEKFLKSEVIAKASFVEKGKNFTRITIDSNCRNIKFVIDNHLGIGNYYGTDGKEPFFGLNKVLFHQKNGNYLIDVLAKSNSEFLKKNKNAWFWLQDGIVIKDKLYSLPFVVTSDLTQPEGFQFKIEGISLVEINVKDGNIDFEHNYQKMTNLYQEKSTRNICMGCAFFDNSLSSNEERQDGYIYIYGYQKEFGSDKGNQLIVARVLPENIKDINKWSYFDGQNFVDDYSKVQPILDHVSCEMSVHYENGKYMAIFTYDVQSRYIAYAFSETPYGPFSETRIAYVCPENMCDHMYLYNAKAHPHLSREGDILVSYNINTSVFEENIKFGRVYGPRFINLKRIGGN